LIVTGVQTCALPIYVVVDFSFHDATAQFAAVCAEHRKALVIGTTGHSDAEKSQISSLKAHIPMVWASNYSTGVNTLFWLTRKARSEERRVGKECTAR